MPSDLDLKAMVLAKVVALFKVIHTQTSKLFAVVAAFDCRLNTCLFVCMYALNVFDVTIQSKQSELPPFVVRCIRNCITKLNWFFFSINLLKSSNCIDSIQVVIHNVMVRAVMVISVCHHWDWCRILKIKNGKGLSIFPV